MQRLLVVCLGGALGSGARFLLSDWAHRRFGPEFPWGTFCVNVVGSFLIGAILRAASESESFPPMLQLALTTGVLGGFTTYSAFNYETIACFERGAWGIAAANLLGTITACLAAGVLGLFAGKLLAGS